MQPEQTELDSAPPPPPIKVALAGAGVVGAGVLRLLSRHAEIIAARCGRRIEVCAVAVRDVNRARKRLPPEFAPLLAEGWRHAAAHPEADITAELMGGETDARECVIAALKNGKAVATANKALLASRGDEIFAAARAAKKPVAFEAAVAGCIPAVKTLREALAADDVYEVAGIINGTCNYILSAMTREGRTFADALADAQARGYAEADPSLDIDGADSAHKIALIARLAFNARPSLGEFLTTGLRDFDPRDVRYAAHFGFCVKMLAQARREKCGGVAISVQPTLLARAHPMAAVGGAMNAILARSVFAGETMYYGAGAGGDPTAAAVVADLMDIARGNGALQMPRDGIASPPVAPSDFRAPHFLRLRALDKPGVLAEIAGALAAQRISIEAIHQHESAPGKQVDIVMLLHENSRGRMDAAAAAIKNLETVFGDAVIMPIQRFDTPPAGR
ncbi:MAG: homoserine dehydrogenase [Gammaproteobacteria bacterium]